ncbi:MAG: hypothetical protein ABJC07_00275, partial [Acidobacteriota bacterium]
AALMYVLDPERGRRRRALARDRAVSIAGKTGDLVAKRSRDIANRAKGVAAEARSIFEREDGESADQRRDPGFSSGSNFLSSEPRSARAGEEPREPRHMSGDPGKTPRVEEEGEL